MKELNRMLLAYELPQIRRYGNHVIHVGNSRFDFDHDPTTQVRRDSVWFIDIFTVQGNGVRFLVPKEGAAK